MQFTSTVLLALTAAAAAVASPEQRPRSDIIANLKRDPTGQGFTHIGSDNVVRTLDRQLRVVDAAPLDGRSESWARDPDTSVLDEIKLATARSYQEIDTRSSKPRDGLEGRQELSCVSENCPNDDWCTGLDLYGYNCTQCIYVVSTIGNCYD